MIAYSQEWRSSAFSMAVEAAFSLPHQRALPNPGYSGDSRKSHTSMRNIIPGAHGDALAASKGGGIGNRVGRLQRKEPGRLVVIPEGLSWRRTESKVWK